MGLLTKSGFKMAPFYRALKNRHYFVITSQLSHKNLLDFSEQDFVNRPKMSKDTICKQIIKLEEFRNFQSVDNREPSRSLYCLKTGLDGQRQLYYEGL